MTARTNDRTTKATRTRTPKPSPSAEHVIGRAAQLSIAACVIVREAVELLKGVKLSGAAPSLAAVDEPLAAIEAACRAARFGIASVQGHRR